jgi:hypothetical protein
VTNNSQDDGWQSEVMLATIAAYGNLVGLFAEEAHRQGIPLPTIAARLTRLYDLNEQNIPSERAASVINGFISPLIDMYRK